METLETRLTEVARIAVRLEQQTACPAQLLIAQWAIESKWGEKPVGHANYFGVKRAARHTQWCTIETREVVNGSSVIENLEFADYDSLADSCRDYTWLITQGAPYHAAWARYQADHDLHTLIVAVAGITRLTRTTRAWPPSLRIRRTWRRRLPRRAERHRPVQQLKTAPACVLLLRQ